MASGDTLKRLFKSYKRLDEDGFLSAALDIINEEKQKKHNVLASDLQRILENGNEKMASSAHFMELQRLPKDRENGTALFDLRTANRYLSEIILEPNLENQVREILHEFYSSEILQANGLTPSRKLLFAGPPGCGKTLCAEVIATELGLPLLYTRFDAVISSYLGETASNLRKIFDFVQTGSWVVFFDEFDAIGKSRDDLSEHGELKRVVNTFLQMLDGFSSNSIFIAATNHETLLDNALWRRFDDILYFEKPNISDIEKLVHLKLSSFPNKNLNVERYLPEMVGWSHADVERVCLDAIKVAILSGHNQLESSFFEKALKRQTKRSELINK